MDPNSGSDSNSWNHVSYSNGAFAGGIPPYINSGIVPPQEPVAFQNDPYRSPANGFNGYAHGSSYYGTAPPLGGQPQPSYTSQSPAMIHSSSLSQPPQAFHQEEYQEQFAPEVPYNTSSGGLGFSEPTPYHHVGLPGHNGPQAPAQAAFGFPQHGTQPALQWQSPSQYPQPTPNGYGVGTVHGGIAGEQSNFHGQTAQPDRQYSEQTFAQGFTPQHTEQEAMAVLRSQPQFEHPPNPPPARRISEKKAIPDVPQKAESPSSAPAVPAPTASDQPPSTAGAKKTQSKRPADALPAPAKGKRGEIRVASEVLEEGLKRMTSAGEEPWQGTKYLVIREQAQIPEAEQLQRMKPLKLVFKKRDQPLFPGRELPIPAEILGSLKSKMDGVKLKGDDTLWTAQAKETFKQLGKVYPEERKTEEEKSAEQKPKDVADLSLDQAVEKTVQYLSLDNWLKENEDVISASANKFATFFRSLRAIVKNARSALDAATDNRADAPTLQKLCDDLKKRRNIVDAVINAALEKGGDAAVKKLAEGEDLKASVVGQLLFLLLNDILKASEVLPTDINGPYPKAILRLLARISPAAEDLEALKFRKVVSSRYKEGGDAEVMKLVDTVVRSAKKRENPEASKNSGELKVNKAEAKKGAASSTRVPSGSSPLKRPLEDNSDSRAAKKVATSAPPVPKSTTGSSAAPKPASKAATGPPQPMRSNLLLPGKPRSAPKPTVAKPAPSKVSIKSDETSKAGPSIGEMAKAAPEKPQQQPTKQATLPSETKIKKAEAPKAAVKAVPTPAPQSKFAAIMAEIQEPKKVSQAVMTPDSASEISETPEEKARRLRKEERRKLRVSWKEGDQLTEIRVFQKDEAEEEGIGGNMIRDARDDRSEGMVLKQSHQRGTEVEEDEEDELPYRPWVEPTLIDFSGLPQKRKDENYVTRGGNKTFHTEQQTVMEQREMRELMVVYTDPADIPPTPKSPLPDMTMPMAAPDEGVHLPNTDPKLQEVHQRWADFRRLGLAWTLYNAQKRLQERAKLVPSEPIDGRGVFGQAGTQGNGLAGQAGFSRPATVSQNVALWYNAAIAAARDEQILGLLTSDKVRSWKDPNPHGSRQTQRIQSHPNPEVQMASDYIETVAARLRGKPCPAQEPPEYMRSDASRVKEWWEGYNRDQQRRAEHSQQAQAQPPTQAGHAQDAAANAQAWAAYYAYYNSQAAGNQAQALPAQQMYDQPYANPYQLQPATPQINPQVQDLLAKLGAGHGGAAPQQSSSANANAQLQALEAALSAARRGPQYQNAQVGSATPAVDNTAQSAVLQTLYQLSANTSQVGGSSQPSGGYGYNYPQPTPQDQNSYDTGSRAGYGQNQPRDQKSHDAGTRSGSGSHHHGGRGDRGDRDRGHQRSNQSSSSSSNVPDHLRNINRNLIGTKPCTYWRAGKCTKGELCTFRHE